MQNKQAIPDFSRVNKLTRRDFIALLASLSPPDPEASARAEMRWHRLCKPIGSLGQLELLHRRLAGVKGTPDPEVRPRAVFIFGADNGIVAEGVTQCGQDVTAQVMRNMAAGRATINTLCRLTDTRAVPVSLGCAALSGDEEGIVHLPIRAEGTRDFAVEDAMTEEEMMMAVQVGLELSIQAARQGYQLLIAGEMGIGNTSTATAVIAALEHTDAAHITGRGAGLSDAGLMHKIDVLRRALAERVDETTDPLTILRAVGGFDIASIVGFYAGAALQGIPVILDGLITMAAAGILLALAPEAAHYLFASHHPAEQGSELILRRLGALPPLDLGIRHGEGAGAVMALPLFDMAVAVYRESPTFDEGGVEAYEVFEDR